MRVRVGAVFVGAMSVGAVSVRIMTVSMSTVVVVVLMLPACLYFTSFYLIEFTSLQLVKVPGLNVVPFTSDGRRDWGRGICSRSRRIRSRGRASTCGRRCSGVWWRSTRSGVGGRWRWSTTSSTMVFITFVVLRLLAVLGLLVVIGLLLLSVVMVAGLKFVDITSYWG